MTTQISHWILSTSACETKPGSIDCTPMLNHTPQPAASTWSRARVAEKSCLYKHEETVPNNAA